MATARNNTAVSSIAAPSGAVGDDSTIVSFWTTETGGDYLDDGTISTNPDALALGDTYSIAVNAITFTQNPTGNETEAMAMRKLTGAVAGGLWVQFHTGDPGANGTSNAISELGRVQVTQAQWTIA